MKKILNDIKNFFIQFPEYIYLIIGIIFLVLFIGVIKNKKWAIDPESSNQRLFYNTFGHNAFRKFIGFVYLLGIISGFSGFLIYILNLMN